MAVKIRLSRTGTKKRPHYAIVVADERSPRDGRFIEKLGTFNPLLPKDAEQVVMDKERVAYWISKGAQPTDRMLRILDRLGLAKRPARQNPQKAMPRKKAQERLAAAKQKTDEAAAAAAPAEAAAQA